MHTIDTDIPSSLYTCRVILAAAARGIPSRHNTNGPSGERLIVYNTITPLS